MSNPTLDNLLSTVETAMSRNGRISQGDAEALFHEAKAQKLRIAQLEAQRRWIPVSERLPANREIVEVRWKRPDLPPSNGNPYTVTGWQDFMNGGCTHWRPVEKLEAKHENS